MLRGILPLALAATVLWGQPPKFEIRGTVTDPNTNQPLQGVNVTMQEGNGAIYPDTKYDRATTDSQGAFRFEPPKAAQYVVRVSKAGYTRTVGISDQGSAILTEEKPSALFTFFLQREGELSGVVIDDETDKPLSGFRLGIRSFGSTNGRIAGRGAAAATTDADGKFRQGIPAGAYLVEIQSQKTAQARVMTQFTAEDIAATDLGYRSQFFPGGIGADLTLSIPVTSGGSSNVGTIRARQQPLYRVYVNLDKSSCPLEGPFSVTENLLRFESNEPRVPTLPCGPFLLTHVTPGNYDIEIKAGNLTASARYTVAEQNIEIPLRLSSGTAMQGTIKPAEGVENLSFERLKVSFGPVAGSVPMAEVQPHDVDDKGRFEFPNLQSKRRKVQVAGLGAEYFIKEVRYRGSAQPGNIFYYTGDGELEIEIGRSPASISGSIMIQDKPLPGADVVFMRWPATPDDDRDAIRHITADADGKFQIAGIVPGEYRLFAVAAKDRSLAEQPAPWQRLVSRAEKLTLTNGASQNLTIQASDPAR